MGLIVGLLVCPGRVGYEVTGAWVGRPVGAEVDGWEVGASTSTGTAIAWVTVRMRCMELKVCFCSRGVALRSCCSNRIEWMRQMRIEEEDDDQTRQSLEGMLSLTAARTRSTAKSPEAIESCILRAIDSLCVYASRLACCNDPNTIDM